MSSHDDSVKLADKQVRAMLDRYRVTSADGFTLAERGTDDVFPEGLHKDQAEGLLARGIARLSDLQARLYAQGTTSLLIVLQAMDAAGKDSTIKHVMSGVNPQGVSVTAFKAPSEVELAHDFLWRITRALPARGTIGLFNRSHYEDVLVGRVRPEILAQSRLPKGVAHDIGIWDRRLGNIAAFERHLVNEGTRVLKIYLHLGRDEQKKRLLARLDEPNKTWKFQASDLKTRALWPAYHDAYGAAIRATATPDAPWFVVPADRKWFARWVVVEAINDCLGSLDLDLPAPTAGDRAALEQARLELEAD